MPKELLLNKPGEGPKQIDRSTALRAEFAWLNPSNATYVPVLLRKWWFDWWTKDYLLQRRGLPRRENLPWEAAKVSLTNALSLDSWTEEPHFRTFTDDTGVRCTRLDPGTPQ